MIVLREGMYRKEGVTCIIDDRDPMGIGFDGSGDDKRVDISAHVDRKCPGMIPESSYVYNVRLSPEEVLKCLLAMPAAKIADAVASLPLGFQAEAKLPEIVKQLMLGAMALGKHAEVLVEAEA